LGRVEYAGKGGQLHLAFCTKVKPCHIVLKGVVAGEAGKFNGEDDIDLSGTDSYPN